MDFRQIEAFVNVVKYHNFSKAAEASFLTQPTISAHISSLEKELGMQLIKRGTKEALPTKQGQIFFKYAVSMLATREKAFHTMRNYNTSIEGALEIFASNVPCQYMLPDLMRSFKNKYPEVTFNVEQGDSAYTNNSIREQRGEIGFSGRRTENDLEYIRLLADDTVLIAPGNEKYRNIAGRRLSIKDIMYEEFVWRELGPGSHREFEKAMSEQGFSPRKMKISVRANNLETTKQAVASGMGIAIISRKAAEDDLMKGRYIIFDIDDFSFEREFFLVSNKQIKLSPTADMFRKHVLEQYDIEEGNIRR